MDYSFDVLVSWDRDLSVYNQSCLYQLYLDFLFYDDYVIPVLIYFTCVLTLLSSVLDTRTHPGSPPGIILLLAWGVSLTPLDSHVQVMELGASGFVLLLIRVAQR